MPELPSGTVTLLFTDIEGSTRLLQELGDGYAAALEEHRRVLRGAFGRHGGIEVDTQGDAFFVAFERATDAVAAAAAAQRELAATPVRVRMGVHTGEPRVTDEGYVGLDVHRAARVMGAGHGGQVLVSETTSRLVGDAFELTDLGEHRLKDLTAPQRLYQLGRGRFPPLLTLHRSTLPAQPTQLVGRRRELVELRELVRSSPLVTLTGPGGSGKTRLALQVAADAADEFEHGVFWVSLAAVRDPEVVLPAIAAAVGAVGELAAHVGDRRMLLVLDNLEQVIECASQLARAIQASPNLKLLVTSREPLRIAAEREYEVPPLVEDEAVELFLVRAHESEPVDSVRAICRRLDSLPLAIELAAARTKLLPPAELLARLDRALPLLTTGARDAPERQRTLRATIEWSYELLDPEERRLFRGLAVFAGGFDLDAAQAVAEADFDTLGSLVDKSLVRRRAGADRYFLFETIREFALDRLGDSGESAQLARRQAEHFLELAEEVGGTHIFEGGEAQRVARLAEETANFRVAIDWALDRDRIDLVCRFGAALWVLWLARGHTSEGRRWLEAAVPRVDPAAGEWVGAAIALGEIARFQGATDRAYELKEQVVRVLADRGETRLRAGTLVDLADIEMEKGAFAQAQARLEASLALRTPDHPAGIGRTISGFAELAMLENQLERADALFAEAFDRFSEVDAASSHAGTALDGRAEVARRRGEVSRAELLCGQSLRIFHALRDPAAIADCLEGFAALAAVGGTMERAGRLVGASQTLRSGSEMAVRWPERVPRDTPAEAQRSGERMDLDEAVAYALSTVD